MTGYNPRPDSFRQVRESRRADGRAWREAEFEMADSTIRVAVASGLGNARALCEAILKGEVHYHFVEIMACPGGCVGGGAASVCYPQTDLYIPLRITVTPDGKVSMVQEELLEDLYQDEDAQ